MSHIRGSAWSPLCLAVPVLLVLACSDPVAVSSDILIARPMRGVLELTNISDAPVYVFVAERNTLAVLDWIPCSNPDACDGIDPDAVLRIPHAEIIGYSAAAEEVVVYHWRLVPGGTASGYVPDSLRAVTVRLR